MIKKTFLTSLIVLFISAFLFSQEYKFSAGPRIGNSLSGSIKYAYDYQYAAELLGGYYSLANFEDLYVSLRGLYHTEIRTVDHLYYFYGAGVNYIFGDNEAWGITTAIGMEYNFDDLPINFSIDFSPSYFFDDKYQFEINPGATLRFVLY